MRFWFLPLLVACHSDFVPFPSAVDTSTNQCIVDADAIENGAPETIVLPPPAPKSPERILLIGDSQVQYMDWYFSRAKVKHENETVFFDSKPGTTIGTWNNYFISEISKYPNLDVVIIFLATNNNNFRYLQPMYNILNEVKRRKLKCLWVGGTEVYGKHHPIINNLVHQAVEPTCTFFDTEEAGIDLLDQVHPSLRGGIKWLQLIWAAKDAL